MDGLAAISPALSLHCPVEVRVLSPRARSVLPARVLAALALAILVGACSRSHPVVTAPGPAPFGRDVPLSCPNMIPNTPETAVQFAAVSGLCASFRPGVRVRFEMTGDLPSPRIDDMGPCATGAAPTIQFLGGHANVFVHGTQTSVTADGQPLTFSPLVPPPTGEKGVVLATDVHGNLFEIIWPMLAGVGPGQPIVRVQLLAWNAALVTIPQTFDVVWDLAAQRDGVTMYMQGRADSLNLVGTAPLLPGAPPQRPCIGSIAGTSDSVVTQFAGIVQFRSNRLRVDVDGDVPTGAIEGAGLCATADVPSVSFSGAADVFRAGSTQSLTNGAQMLTFGALLPPAIALAPGGVVATDAAGDALHILWPKIAGLGSRPPAPRPRRGAGAAPYPAP